MLSLRNLNLLLIPLILLVSACGFHPVYGDSPYSVSSPLKGNLIIDPLKGRDGQILKAALEDKLNPEGITSATPEYHLTLTLTKTMIPSVIKSDGTIQRYDIRYDSSFTLSKLGEKTSEYIGAIHRTSSYNVATNANFSTYETEQDTIERMLKEIAEDYFLRLTGHFSQDTKK